MRQTLLTSGVVVVLAGSAFAAAFLVSHKPKTPGAVAAPVAHVPVLALPKAHPLVRRLSAVAALPAAPAVAVHAPRTAPVRSQPVASVPHTTYVAPTYSAKPKPQSTVIIPVPAR